MDSLGEGQGWPIVSLDDRRGVEPLRASGLVGDCWAGQGEVGPWAVGLTMEWRLGERLSGGRGPASTRAARGRESFQDREVEKCGRALG